MRIDKRMRTFVPVDVQLIASASFFSLVLGLVILVRGSGGISLALHDFIYFFGRGALQLVLIILAFGIFMRAIGGLVFMCLANDSSSRRAEQKHTVAFISAVMPPLLYVFIVVGAMASAVNIFITHILPDLVLARTQHLASLESFLGRSIIPSFALADSLLSVPLLWQASVWGYLNVAFQTGGAALILLWNSAARFRVFVAANAIALMLALPMWIAVPVVSPQQYYLQNIFHNQFTDVELQAINSFKSSARHAYWEEQMRMLAEFWPTDTARAVAATAFPSMHVAWAVIVLLALWPLGRLWRLIASIWAGLTVLGTILLLQHFVLDIPAGMLLGAAAYLLGVRLVRYAEKRPASLFDSTERHGAELRNYWAQQFSGLAQRFSPRLYNKNSPKDRN